MYELHEAGPLLHNLPYSEDSLGLPGWLSDHVAPYSYPGRSFGIQVTEASGPFRAPTEILVFWVYKISIESPNE